MPATMSATATIAPAAAMQSARINWRDYFALCKPRVVLLILFTALVGMFLATDGLPPFAACFWGLLGIALAASAGAALNHVVDHKIDAAMRRTEHRPLPSGRVGAFRAAAFAVMLAALSMAVLLIFVNALTAALTFASMTGYAVIYSMFLKRATPQNIVLGGAAGAAPPVLGWSAISGTINPQALLLFLIIFVWTPPHFWALAVKRVDEYAAAGVPMLPVAYGVALTKLHILLYAILLLAVTVIPFITGMSGGIYLTAALILGGGFVWHAARLYRAAGDQYAMKTFRYSIFYLSALFAFLLLDHYAWFFAQTAHHALGHAGHG